MKRMWKIGVCLVLVLMLAGCGASPNASVQALFEALHEGDVAAANALFTQAPFNEVVTSTFGSYQTDAIRAVFANTSAEIHSSSTRGDTAQVSLTITTTDGAKAMAAARAELWAVSEDVRNMLGEETWQQLLASKDAALGTTVLSTLTDARVQKRMVELYQDAFRNVDTVTANVTINLTQQDGKWLFTSDNKALLSALFGGAQEEITEADLFIELLP